MAKRCPACHHPVDDDVNACPNCPASWESDEDAAARRANAPQFGLRRLVGPAQLAVMAVITLFVAGNALYLIVKWQDRHDPPAPARQPQADPLAAVQAAGALGRAAQAGAGQDPAQVMKAASALAAQASASGQEASPSSGGATADEDDDSGVVLIAHDQSAHAASHWRFRGRVLDLETLKPVSHCRLEFTDPDGSGRFQTASDAQGRYRVELPPANGRGYAVLIHAEGYAASYLDPATQDVERMAAEDRRDLAKNLTHSLAGPYQVSADSDKPVLTDFFLASEN